MFKLHTATSTLIILSVMILLIIGGAYMGIAIKYVYDENVELEDLYADKLKLTYILVLVATALLGLGVIMTLAIPAAQWVFKRRFVVDILSICEAVAYLGAGGAFVAASFYAFTARSPDAEFEVMWRQLTTAGIFCVIMAMIAMIVGGFALTTKRQQAEDDMDLDS